MMAPKAEERDPTGLLIAGYRHRDLTKARRDDNAFSFSPFTSTAISPN